MIYSSRQIYRDFSVGRVNSFQALHRGGRQLKLPHAIPFTSALLALYVRGGLVKKTERGMETETVRGMEIETVLYIYIYVTAEHGAAKALVATSLKAYTSVSTCNRSVMGKSTYRWLLPSKNSVPFTTTRWAGKFTPHARVDVHTSTWNSMYK